MNVIIVMMLGVALLAMLRSAHDSWEDIHDDSENEK